MVALRAKSTKPVLALIIGGCIDKCGCKSGFDEGHLVPDQRVSVQIPHTAVGVEVSKTVSAGEENECGPGRG